MELFIVSENEHGVLGRDDFEKWQHDLEVVEFIGQFTFAGMVFVVKGCGHQDSVFRQSSVLVKKKVAALRGVSNEKIGDFVGEQSYQCGGLLYVLTTILEPKRVMINFLIEFTHKSYFINV